MRIPRKVVVQEGYRMYDNASCLPRHDFDISKGSRNALGKAKAYGAGAKRLQRWRSAAIEGSKS